MAIAPEPLMAITAFSIIAFIMLTAEVCGRQLAKHKLSKREKYDFLVAYFFHKYASGSEVPDFMNRQAYRDAHARAVYLAQQGKLDKCYKQLRGKLCA